MTRKTFESIGNCLELSVGKVGHEDLLGVELRHTNGRWVGIASIAPSDAPALMLAIGEAIDDGATTVKDGSPEGYMEAAKHYLRQAIAAIAYEADEAKEQAELEAEALDFCNAHREALDLGHIRDFREMVGAGHDGPWLAVARRARETGGRAEK